MIDTLKERMGNSHSFLSCELNINEKRRNYNERKNLF